MGYGPTHRTWPAIAVALTVVGVLAIGPTTKAQAASSPEFAGLLQHATNGSRFAESWRLKFGGWLNAGFTFNPGQPGDHINGPVSFSDRANEFQLNQLNVYAERKPRDLEDQWDWGGRFDFVFGSDAIFTRSLGDPGDHWDAHLLHRRVYGISLPQIYLELAVPIGKGLHVKLGEFYTIIGHESVMAPDNFFYSHAYTMQYGEPFSHTGVLASSKFNDIFELQAGAVTGSPLAGWDGGFQHGIENWAFVGGLHWTSPTTGNSISLTATQGDWNSATSRELAFYSIVARHDFNDRLHGVLQHDHGWISGAGESNHDWYSLVGYLAFDIDDKLAVGTRMEWFRDDDGVRVTTSAREPTTTLPASNYFAATLGLNWKPMTWLMIRPNLRVDLSDGATAFEAGRSDHQYLVSLDALLTLQ